MAIAQRVATRVQAKQWFKSAKMQQKKLRGDNRRNHLHARKDGICIYVMFDFQFRNSSSCILLNKALSFEHDRNADFPTSVASLQTKATWLRPWATPAGKLALQNLRDRDIVIVFRE
ncbi:MAG: hypothetical protein ONB44_20805 [candidate division KSB1 bacterium]|nr:hypothetical protein [candidate division KSB1 bacterium]MDZ7304573.1 hypothetical protein [candidate division KSB1 bacterium]MDZ7313632.1 hypothetical protein [candidate division KSB1 bacterium]